MNDEEIDSLLGYDFWDEVRQAYYRGQREGQAVFNTAARFYGNRVAELAAIKFDPFYSDDNIPLFLERVLEILTRP